MLNDKDWGTVYRTGDQDLFSDFYSPAFASSIRYDRAVGFFSSRLLSAALQGVSKFLKREGKIRLVIGSPLEPDEYVALQHGTTLEQHVEHLDAKLFSLLQKGDSLENKRLEILAWMVATNSIEIKYALRLKGMYHEKIGIFSDEEGDQLVFLGSANETPSAMMSDFNAESIMVFPSWKPELFEAYGKPCVDSFEELWRGRKADTYTIDVKSETYRKIAEYASNEIKNIYQVDEQSLHQKVISQAKKQKRNQPYVPEFLNGNRFLIKKFQRNALTAWKQDGYHGILKLATGSGKTITAIYGAIRLYEATKKLALVISVPYVELANQWSNVLGGFGINPIRCYEQTNLWTSKLENTINLFNSDRIDFFACVVVNKSLTGYSFQTLMERMPERHSMFIGDECHNHGSSNIANKLPEARFKLGLSATPFRADSDEDELPFPDYAKDNILKYYQQISYEYNLSDAINDGVLCQYHYHIVPVHLDDEEFEEYSELTRKIGKILAEGEEPSSNEFLTMLFGKRTRLLGGVASKLTELKRIAHQIPESKRDHTIFYCGEGRNYLEDDPESIIDNVTRVLNGGGWRI